MAELFEGGRNVRMATVTITCLMVETQQDNHRHLDRYQYIYIHRQRDGSLGVEHVKGKNPFT